LLQGKSYQTQAYNVFDLWQKDDSGNWGKSIGTIQSGMNVTIGTHQTKVWKAVPVQQATMKRAYKEL
jgi:alpha-galactosidase